MRPCKAAALVFLAVTTCASHAATLYYSIPGDTSEIHSVDTVTGAQALAMTLQGQRIVALASSPVPGSMYAIDLVQPTLGENYSCLRLVDVAAGRNRLVGCSRSLTGQIAFDAGRDLLYGGGQWLLEIAQRTAQGGVPKSFGFGLIRANQGMALAHDAATGILYGAGEFLTESGFYTIDPQTAVPAKRGTKSYRSIFVEPASGVMYGIAADAGTSGTPELQIVDKVTGTGTRVVTLAAGASSLAAPPVASPTIALAEYRHAAFDHYFITGDPAEIAKLDSGQIAGWARTGELFASFPLGSYGTANTCRFFSTAFAPKSSHFYAANAGECATVKSNPSWMFEGEVFAQIPSPPDGGCAAGLLSLYRLYNNGQGGAPAHRYVVRDELRSAQLRSGWVAEGAGPGVVGCVVPAYPLRDSAAGVWIGTSVNPVSGPSNGHEDVHTIVLESGSVYQLYVDYGSVTPPSIGAIVQGTGTARDGKLTSANASGFRFPFAYLTGATGAVAPTTLAAEYVPESALNGKADGEAEFGAAWQTGYHDAPDLQATAGTFTGPLGSMNVGTGVGSPAMLTVAVGGAVSGTVGACTYAGTLVPRVTSLFDVTVAFSGATCPASTATLRGVAYYDALQKALSIVAVDDARTDAFGFFGRKP